jgi:hypothetical protein
MTFANRSTCYLFYARISGNHFHEQELNLWIFIHYLILIGFRAFLLSKSS